MKLHLNENRIDAVTGEVPGIRVSQESNCPSRGNSGQVICISPTSVDVTGENRLQANTDSNGTRAHAAVRMHADPVIGFFWGYFPKAKTTHFQRLKVAT